MEVLRKVVKIGLDHAIAVQDKDLLVGFGTLGSLVFPVDDADVARARMDAKAHERLAHAIDTADPWMFRMALRSVSKNYVSSATCLLYDTMRLPPLLRIVTSMVHFSDKPACANLLLMVNTLIEAEADLTAVDSRGRTALDILLGDERGYFWGRGENEKSIQLARLRLIRAGVPFDIDRLIKSLSVVFTRTTPRSAFTELIRAPEWVSAIHIHETLASCWWNLWWKDARDLIDAIESPRLARRDLATWQMFGLAYKLARALSDEERDAARNFFRHKTVSDGDPRAKVVIGDGGRYDLVAWYKHHAREVREDDVAFLTRLT